MRAARVPTWCASEDDGSNEERDAARERKPRMRNQHLKRHGARLCCQELRERGKIAIHCSRREKRDSSHNRASPMLGRLDDADQIVPGMRPTQYGLRTVCR